ncbi:hypothetical protein L249_7891, partial [Ophiocordyceps polyrhachis-furcata BCC 54312]
AKVAPFFEQGEEYTYNTEHFLNYLDSTAIAELEKLVQRPTKSFSDFLIRFKAKRDIPYNDYARAVSSDIIKQRCVNSICLRYSIPGHFLKSCNLRLARRLSILRMRFVDMLTRYNVLVRASRRELIVYSADNLPARDLVSAPHYPYS